MAVRSEARSVMSMADQWDDEMVETMVVLKVLKLVAVLALWMAGRLADS